MKRTWITLTLVGVFSAAGAAVAMQATQPSSGAERTKPQPGAQQPGSGAGGEASGRAAQAGTVPGVTMRQGMMNISCRQAMRANVTVENNDQGAIVRITTQDREQVQNIQRMAQMLQSCASGGTMGNGNGNGSDMNGMPNQERSRPQVR